ncbi:MAG: hypothetical protein ABT03_05100 [Comamonas sp. SCN 67-35]|nr:MAG: hypothetical protein ABT03_05100 [Comamonas sp. SCN 67-35]OJW98429.1 MAG: hypothetical protein BGO73_12345 [Burkholderiales bacterium 66-26]
MQIGWIGCKLDAAVCRSAAPWHAQQRKMRRDAGSGNPEPCREAKSQVDKRDELAGTLMF